MDEQPLQLPAAVDGYSGYDLRSVERFLLEACEERGRVMEEIATARRRIAEVDAELAQSSETELRLARMVIDAQRVIREERRANDRAVAALRSDGEAQAERILSAAREQVAAMRASLR
ncbi:MAG TPA: DivIVA domain-containing protein, partial [Acidimicrobiales bacterium]